MIPYSIRQLIVQQRLSGKSLIGISEDLNISYSSIRRIWRLYRNKGPQGLKAVYDNCGKKPPSEDNLIYRAACWLKFLHRSWGADCIKQRLEQRYPKKYVPHERTLQRWFKKKNLNQLIFRRIPKEKQLAAQQVHQIWQVDAKERFTLKNGQPACYLNMTDEYSGGFIKLAHFPPQSY